VEQNTYDIKQEKKLNSIKLYDLLSVKFYRLEGSRKQVLPKMFSYHITMSSVTSALKTDIEWTVAIFQNTHDGLHIKGDGKDFG